MELAAELRRALDGLCAIGAPEVRENGEWLAGLEGVQYEVSAQGDAALLHLWSAQQSLVRRVLRVAEESRERVVLEVSRLGYSRHAQLEFVAGGAPRETRRVEREQFSSRLRRILTDHFPDETVESLATSADLHHSISGSYTRGLVRRGSEAHAVLAASPNEDGATIDGILTFGLIWLQHTRDRARRYSVHGLRLFLPRGSSSITAHRMAALASPQEVELYEYEPLYWRVRRIARSNAGNLATWIVPRREIEQAIAAAMPLAERIRRLAPEAIRVGVAPATQEVTLRFRGLEFARWRLGAMWFGLGDHQECFDTGKMARPRSSGPAARNAPPPAGFGHQTPALPRAAGTLAGNHGGRRPGADRCAARSPAHLRAGSGVFFGRSRNHRFAGSHAGRPAGRSRTEGFRRHSTGDAGGRLLAARALSSRSGRLSQVRIFPGSPL